MSVKDSLFERSESKCELCTATNALDVYEIPPTSDGSAEQSILVCDTCKNEIENLGDLDVKHWRCLNDSMWSQVPAVQVMAWRMLTRLSGEVWARDQLDMLYLEDDVLAWAQSGSSGDAEEQTVKHLDSNGAVLEAGDTVTLIKDLNVKGANFTAKRGTAVRGISLVRDNAKQIEGRVSGQQIVILTEFVKKS
ncbi:MAG: PhnA domain-containing protein [Rhodospirillales bacterium]|nr:PhnA domain-containing protein [Rhodospirillales bacterium]